MKLPGRPAGGAIYYVMHGLVHDLSSVRRRTSSLYVYYSYLIAAPRIDGRHVYSIAPSRAVPPVCGATNEGLG